MAADEFRMVQVVRSCAAASLNADTVCMLTRVTVFTRERVFTRPYGYGVFRSPSETLERLLATKILGKFADSIGNGI